jgi:hypothetical protein
MHGSMNIKSEACIGDFQKGHQPRTNIVKDEGDLVTDCHSILARWKNHLSQLFSVQGVSYVRQTDIHIAEPLMPEPSAFEVEMATEKLKGNKSPDVDQIREELIKAGDRTICSEIHKHINSIWNMEEMPEERKVSVNVSIHKKGDKTV